MIFALFEVVDRVLTIMRSEHENAGPGYNSGVLDLSITPHLIISGTTYETIIAAYGVTIHVLGIAVEVIDATWEAPTDEGVIASLRVVMHLFGIAKKIVLRSVPASKSINAAHGVIIHNAGITVEFIEASSIPT